jgi:hypothetical protein
MFVFYVDNSKEDEAVENEHYLKMTKKKAVKVYLILMIQVRLTSARINLLHVVIQQPKTAYKVRSTAPALAVCHPGASYNPTFEDHQVGTSCHLGYRVS